MAANANIDKDRIILETQSSYATPPPADHVALMFDDITGSPLPMYMLPGDTSPRSFGTTNEITLFNGAPTSGAYDVATNTADALLCTHLKGRAWLKSTVAATTDIAYMFFNADTTVTNYRHAANAVTEAGTNAPVGGNTPRIGNIAANSSPANEFAMIEFDIQNFRDTSLVKKIAYTISLYFNTGASFQHWSGGIHWNSTAAITALKLRTDNHNTDTLNSSCLLHLVGVKV